MSKTDFTKQPEQIVLDLINSANTRKVTADQVTIGAPVAGTDKKTSVTLTAKSTSPMQGSQTFTYRRVDMDEVTDNDTSGAALVVDAAKGEDVIAAYNRKFGVNLTAADVLVNGREIDQAYEQPDDYSEILIQAKDASLVWIGDTIVRIRPVNELFGMPDDVSVASDGTTNVVRAAEDGVVRVFAL